MQIVEVSDLAFMPVPLYYEAVHDHSSTRAGLDVVYFMVRDYTGSAGNRSD